jgi:hypothetical protein
MAPVLIAVYITGLAALRERLGSMSLPEIRFWFRSVIRALINFFSVGWSKSGRLAGMSLRPALVMNELS